MIAGAHRAESLPNSTCAWEPYGQTFYDRAHYLQPAVGDARASSEQPRFWDIEAQRHEPPGVDIEPVALRSGLLACSCCPITIICRSST